MSVKTVNTNTMVMSVLKVATCPTNSGRANLIYHIGCNEAHDLHFRISANTGGGFFSPEWVSLNTMLITLDAAPKPITSYPLLPLLTGRSVNTPAFLLAALKNEGLVRNLTGKSRGFEMADSHTFMTEVKALIASGVDLKVSDIFADYKTSTALKPKKAIKTIDPIQARREQRRLKSLLSKQ